MPISPDTLWTWPKLISALIARAKRHMSYGKMSSICVTQIADQFLLVSTIGWLPKNNYISLSHNVSTPPTPGSCSVSMPVRHSFRLSCLLIIGVIGVISFSVGFAIFICLSEFVLRTRLLSLTKNRKPIALWLTVWTPKQQIVELFRLSMEPIV